MGTRILNGIALKYTVIFAVYLLCGWYVADKGLDLTDTGYHLANQMRAAALGTQYIGFLPVYWFSDFLSGTLFQHFNLLQLRWVVVAMGVGQLIVLLHLFRNQKLPLTWPLTIVTALLGAFMLAPIGFLLMLPDYYAIPTTVLYLTMPVLVAFLTRPSALSTVALVALTFLLLNLRFTTGILVATLPATIAVIQFIAFRTKPNFRYLAAYYLSLAVLAGLEALYITTSPTIWPSVTAAEWRNPLVHNANSILRSYVTETLRQFFNLWPIALATILFTITKRTTRHPALTWEKLPHALLAAWFAATLFRAFAYGPNFAVTVQSLTITSYVIGVSLIVLQWFTARHALKQNAAFILTGMALPIALFAGSNTGIIKLAYCLPLLVAAVLVLARNLPPRLRNQAFPALVVFYALGLLLVTNTGLRHAYENVQITPTAQLTYTLQNGKLHGIKTTPLSGPAVDATVAQILALTSPTDTIFTFPSVPLFHYATARQNVIGNIPNFDILQPMHAIAAKIGRLCTTAQFTPKVIVFSRHYIFHPLWGTYPNLVDAMPPNNDWGVQISTAELLRIVESNCHPTILWQNEYFTLLAPHPNATAQ